MKIHAAVYALIRANGYPPHPRTVYEALGLTKREYYAALRTLERLHFIERSGWDKRWAALQIVQRYCACGTEITPLNAVFVKGKRRLYVRKHCVTCYNAAQIVRVRAWDERNPGYQTRIKRRFRQQQRSATP